MVGEEHTLTVTLDRLKKTVETNKKNKDPTGRKVTWTYVFESLEGEKITVKSKQELGWVEDESYTVTVVQPHYQSRLADPEAKAGKKASKKKGAK